MKVVYLGLLLAPVALAGHWSACAVPGGKRDDDATTKCCNLEAGGKSNLRSGNYHFDSGYHDCRSTQAGDNALDSGSFAKCCTNEGFGSVGE